MAKYSLNTRKKDIKTVDEWLGNNTRFKDNHVANPRRSLIYTDEQFAFIKAMDQLKRKLRRMPTCSEILTEAKRLGYEKDVVQ